MTQTLMARIDGWPERAARAGWCVATLAEQHGCSVSTLERYFQDAFCVSPQDWLLADRMRRAREGLERGELIRVLAAELCYGHSQNFSVAFRRHHGYPPSRHGEEQSAIASEGAKCSRGWTGKTVPI